MLSKESCNLGVKTSHHPALFVWARGQQPQGQCNASSWGLLEYVPGPEVLLVSRLCQGPCQNQPTSLPSSCRGSWPLMRTYHLLGSAYKARQGFWLTSLPHVPCVPYTLNVSPNSRTSSSFFFFNWSIVDLQCWVSFRCTSKWSRYLFFFRFFALIGYYKILSIVPCAIQ